MKAWQCFMICAPLWAIAAQIAAQSFFWLGVFVGLFSIINAAIESNKGKP